MLLGIRTADQVTGCIEAFQASAECRSAVTVYEARHPPFNSFTLSDGMLTPMFDPKVLLQQRQSLPTVYRSNGAVYVIDREVFLEHGTFYVPPTLAYVMPEEDSVDIDTKADFDLAEFHMARRGGGS